MTTTDLRGELYLTALRIETMREFVVKERGRGAGELLEALGELQRAFELCPSRSLSSGYLLVEVGRCDRALEEWRPGGKR